MTLVLKIPCLVSEAELCFFARKASTFYTQTVTWSLKDGWLFVMVIACDDYTAQDIGRLWGSYVHRIENRMVKAYRARKAEGTKP